MINRIKELFATTIHNVYIDGSPVESLVTMEELQGLVDDLIEENNQARKLLAPECKHVGFSIQYTE